MRDLPGDPAPTQTFAFEPDAARTLEWLPLAVRYKLDQCGLRVGLKPWQALAHRQRARLLTCPPGEAFGGLALALFGDACRRDRFPSDPGRFGDYLARKCGVGLEADGAHRL